MAIPPSMLPAHRELEAARRSLAAMRAATDFRVTEDEWRRVLDLLERTWNKLELAAKSSAPLKSAWIGGYIHFRRDDPLLCYLSHARNADNHTLQEIVRTDPGFMAVGIAPGASVGYVEELIISNGEVQRFKGTNTRVVKQPPQVVLLPVRDRGVEYIVPREHCGFAIADAAPTVVADLAISFYDFAISEASERLLSTPSV